MLVDSHCHLEYKGLVEDQAGVLSRAREAGVGAFLNISTKQSEWEQACPEGYSFSAPMNKAEMELVANMMGVQQRSLWVSFNDLDGDRLFEIIGL